jgi:Ca2+-binding RTX toxin-like protein
MRTRVIGPLCLAVLAIAAPAHAAKATQDTAGRNLMYVADFGEQNNLRIGLRAGSLIFTDGSLAIRTGPGCRVDPSGFERTCSTAGMKSLIVYLGDRNDKMPDPDLKFELPAGMKLIIRAGNGNDSIIGTEGNDTLDGGAGADRVYGSGGKKDKLSGDTGNDRLTGFGTLKGGPGKDFIEAFYGFGQFKAGRSRIYAGSGNDKVLSGNGVRDFVDCGKGKDRATTGLDRRGVDRIKRNCERRR